MKIVLSLLIAFAMIGGAAQAQMKLPALKKQPTPQAVLDEHLAALNACDWDRLLAQYPEDAQINLPNGVIVKGRAAIGDLFAGFCKDPKDGGLKGLHFAPEHSTTIENTLRRNGWRLRPSWRSRTEAPTPTSPMTAICRPWSPPLTAALSKRSSRPVVFGVLREK